jgi:UDP-N-acetyl-alpha-D-muramoyl-L-alanyl-L-glutamate epimerase
MQASIMTASPKAKTFAFTSYELDPKRKQAVFRYEIRFEDRPTMAFSETVIFPREFSLSDVPSGLLENVLVSVHIMLGISYYKLYCPKEIVSIAPLSEDQAVFWNTVYRKGLGEFFFRNGIDPSGLIAFPYVKGVVARPFPLKKWNDRSLVGIGGGKDSIVAGELLKGNGEDVTALLIETQRHSPVSNRVVEEMGVPSMRILRLLDEALFEKHEGAHNGHIPISAVFAMLGYLTAVLYDYARVVVGNEYSSNFGNVTYAGEEVNHQWSKSSEFEDLFRRYANAYFSPDITYFSLLRPFHEIRIAKMFSKHTEYFPYFTSCNRSFRVHESRPDTLWCGECAKCVFVFTLLSAFLTEKDLLRVFGRNLFDDKNLVPLFGDVLGFGDMKPFDCVGTFEEARAALYLSAEKYGESVIMRTFMPRIGDASGLLEDVSRYRDAPVLPDRYKLLGIESVLVLGYGKEGKSTEKYLRRRFPELGIGLADKDSDPEYLERQKTYDLAIKTPGIPKGLVTIPYTTATNLFFSEVRNVTIGITGSKGKSTTASLTYEMLKQAGKKVRLLGNIGNPMLAALSGPIDPEEIFVLELSSYQLDDIRYAPDIAVALNLFPEHMTYHGDKERYYEAKRNIVSLQMPGDVFFYDGGDARLAAWAESAASEAVSFSDISLRGFESRLIGSHNEKNIRAAIAVARRFDVSDTVIRKTLAGFLPLRHRLENIGTYHDITFYDDAISTAPESTIVALEAVPDVDTLFLGGEDRGYDFSELERRVREKGVRNIVLFPDSGRSMLRSRDGLNVFETESMKDAVAFAYAHTGKGKACLLSAASPSYSLWKNFEEKGDQFRDWVIELGGER